MKIENKKTVKLILGILVLLISIIGASYAYFTVDINNNFETPKIDASTSSIGTVSLKSTDNNLYLNLTRSNMISTNTGEYYAVTEENGVASSSKNEIEIGQTQVIGNGTYNCNYTLSVANTGDMKEALTKEGILTLTVNDIDYDIYSTDFPLTINGTFNNISSSSVGKIIASLKFINANESQNELINKNIKLEIDAEEFNCTAIEKSSVYAQVVSDYTNGNGVSKLSDSDKGSRTYDTYYYTGNITNNNVLYADHCWKMVITTEGEGVKMIYNGVPSNGSCDNSGDATTIGTSAFNDSYNSPTYVGYMYNKVYTSTYKSMSSDTTEYVYGNSVTWDGSNYTLVNTKSGAWSSVYDSLDYNHYTCFTTGKTCSSVYYIHYTSSTSTDYITLTEGVNIEEALKEMLYADDVNTTDSTIKAKIDSWYESNLKTTQDREGNLYSSYLQNTIYCNNRTTPSLGLFDPNGGSSMYSRYSLEFNYNTLDCENKADQFTLSLENGGTDGYGNNVLKYPIGLISYKEASLAIGSSDTNYLNNSSSYWLLSPTLLFNSFANGSIVDNDRLVNLSVHGYCYVRPAITLSSSVKITSGDGSVNRPYVVGLV